MANERLVTLASSVDRFYDIQIINASKLKYDGKEDVLEYSLKKAWGPAVSGVSRRPDSSFPKTHKEAINDYRDNVLKKALQYDINQYKPCAGFDIWINDFCKLHSLGMKAHIKQKGIAVVMDSYYGIVQKYVNITFKYLYCFCIKNKSNYTAWDKANKYDEPFYKDCHCPVDNQISAALVKNFIATKSEKNTHGGWLQTIDNINETTWSFMTEEDYKEFQKIVKNICTAQIITSKLFFDFLYW